MHAGQDNYGLPKGIIGSCIQLSTPTGYGSTATYTKYFTVVEQQVGSAIALLNDPVYGSRFVIRESGVYCISYTGDAPGSGSALCIAKNSAYPGSSSPANAACVSYSDAGSGTYCAMCVTLWCNVGDTFTASGQGSNLGTATAAYTKFIIARCG